MPSKAKLPEPNTRFGSWTFLSEISTGFWLCRCDCGVEKSVRRLHIMRGTSLSCGHGASERATARSTTHGESSGSKLYYSWRNAKSRCNNPNNKKYKTYGARGIKMWEPWVNDFLAFKAYVGDAPSTEHSLGRIDNDKGYEPGNLEWQTYEQQSRNRTSNRLISYNGKTQTLTGWAEELKIDREVLSARILRLKWGIEKAFTTPTRHFNVGFTILERFDDSTK